MSVGRLSPVELDEIARNLHSPVIGDVLDAMGLVSQFLPAEIRVQVPSTVLVGYAMPVIVQAGAAIGGRPFGLLTEALDALKPNDVYLAAASEGDCAAWGEILTTVAKRNGARGAVIDGYHRDTRGIRRLEWPVMSRGSYAQDARVRSSVTEFNCSVRIGDVDVMPGDFIFGDVDGVVVVPQSITHEVLHNALEKLRTENKVLTAILKGMTATEAFDTFDVL